MPSIKDLKSRIGSTKNTQQTTKAMKMVSAAKLRRATEAIMSQRPYAKEIARMMGVLAAQGAGPAERTAAKPVTLVVAFSSDRGLCGGYNGSVIRATLNCLGQKAAEGKAVKCVFVGKKAFEGVKIRSKVDLAHYEEFGAKISFRKAGELSKKILPPLRIRRGR